jgi:adenylate cyclase
MADRLEGTEIERKFLVARMPENLDQYPHALIRQGYLASGPGAAQVRLRQKGESCYLTVKGPGGPTRIEEEIEIDARRFEALWPLTEGARLEKTRHDIPDRSHTIELDIYHGRLAGVVVAEVEFDSEAEAAVYQPPDWLGADVSNDPRYSNTRMAKEGF